MKLIAISICPLFVKILAHVVRGLISEFGNRLARNLQLDLLSLQLKDFAKHIRRTSSQPSRHPFIWKAFLFGPFPHCSIYKCFALGCHSHASYREVAAWHCPGRLLHKLRCEVKTHQSTETRSSSERVKSVFDANRFQGGKQHSFFDFYRILDSSQKDCREWMIVLNGGDHSGVDEKLTNSDEVGRRKFHSRKAYHCAGMGLRSLSPSILQVADSLLQASGQRNHLRNNFEVPLLCVLRVMQSLMNGLHICASYHCEVEASSLAPADKGATRGIRQGPVELVKNIGLDLLFVKSNKIVPRNSDFDRSVPSMDLSEYVSSSGNGPRGNPFSRNALPAGPFHHRILYELSELICHSGESYHREVSV